MLGQPFSKHIDGGAVFALQYSVALVVEGEENEVVGHGLTNGWTNVATRARAERVNASHSATSANFFMRLLARAR